MNNSVSIRLPLARVSHLNGNEPRNYSSISDSLSVAFDDCERLLCALDGIYRGQREKTRRGRAELADELLSGLHLAATPAVVCFGGVEGVSRDDADRAGYLALRLGELQLALKARGEEIAASLIDAAGSFAEGVETVGDLNPLLADRVAAIASGGFAIEVIGELWRARGDIRECRRLPPDADTKGDSLIAKSESLRRFLEDLGQPVEVSEIHSLADMARGDLFALAEVALRDHEALSRIEYALAYRGIIARPALSRAKALRVLTTL